ncbi:MAG TPA: ATP-binding protein [Fontimonas sp.]
MQTVTDDVARLRLSLAPLLPSTTIDQAADLFLSSSNARMLCLPVVGDDGLPVGTVSRHTLNGIFLTRYGRELYGNKPITTVMNREALIVEQTMPLEQAAAYVTAKLGSPITEDFVIVDQGRYAGMGIVLDLLSALEQRVAGHTQQLQGAYSQLQASQAQLVQSEKMASLGQMVAGVAHEINTPLGYVRNNVEMIQGVFGLTAEALRTHQQLLRLMTDEGTEEAQLAAAMNACAQSMDAIGDVAVIDDAQALFTDTLFGVDTICDLVVNLRNFSRLDQAKTVEVSINDCLDQTLTIANNVLKNRVEVIKRYGDVPKLRCSPSQINQVLLNMMTNAAQAIEHDQGKLLLKTEFDGTWVRIHIQDNGKGIPQAQIDKIFDPFFTTKPVGHGTGLGLSISFQIIQAHGGAIRVVSEPGRGTKFVISLPLRGTDALAA